jgi:hypothetical protein
MLTTAPQTRVRIKTGVVSQFPSHREVPSFAPLHTTPFHFTANKISGFVEQASKPLAAKKFRDFFLLFGHMLSIKCCNVSTVYCWRLEFVNIFRVPSRITSLLNYLVLEVNQLS